MQAWTPVSTPACRFARCSAPKETEETTTTRGFQAGRKSSNAAQKVRVAAFAAEGSPRLNRLNRRVHFSPGRSVMRKPTVSSTRSPTGSRLMHIKPAHYAIVARGLLAEQTRRVGGRCFPCRSRFPVHAFSSCTVSYTTQGARGGLVLPDYVEDRVHGPFRAHCYHSRLH